jgi:hypothetical protein
MGIAGSVKLDQQGREPSHRAHNHDRVASRWVFLGPTGSIGRGSGLPEFQKQKLHINE